MRRRLLNLLTALSLLLCAGVVVLWVRSYDVADQVRWNRYGGAGLKCTNFQWGLFPTRGRLIVSIDWGWELFATVEDADAVRAAGVAQPAIRWRPQYPLQPLPPSESPWGRLGFGPARWESWVRNPGPTRVPPATTVRHSSWFGILPLWCLCAVGLLLPAWRTITRIRSESIKRAALRGRCPVCGYDLRATPGRCPECGTPVG